MNSFQLRCLKRILGITWQGKVPNTEVVNRAKLPSMYALLSQRRLRWLGHVYRMKEGRMPKDILYTLRKINPKLCQKGTVGSNFTQLGVFFFKNFKKYLLIVSSF